MKNFLKSNAKGFFSLLLLTTLFCLLLLSSLLLEIPFINKMVVRQLIVYLLMLLQCFIFLRAIILINSTK